CRELDGALGSARRGLEASRRAEAAAGLRALAERIRFASALEPLPAEQARDLARRCRAVWGARHRLLGAGGEARLNLEVGLRTALLDVAVITAQLEVRLAAPGSAGAARRAALALLDEAEALCGGGALLDQERVRHGGRAPRAAREPRTA